VGGLHCKRAVRQLLRINDMQTKTSPDSQRIREVLADAKRLAVEYYKLTGKPLGVTGEVAEFVAAENLGLQLVSARTPRL
jgi:hypothetical protein